ncbi:PEP-CTERM protein-sorting domain-containing protein [Prosthecobacter debontii]|uniref:PEP-CTERM protein-sorting domain-containing protein n=1 Tax=Prosthecobacter debontii TaxID=48467 RepID=A0A1T4XJY5_9BACT|nr:vanadium-dependent haloperoxidase [Prosthecobacter debontii]SKA89435.1 PEP-CTERM protein-sorting domain-containing protein [Prosthecobacter debontii]
MNKLSRRFLRSCLWAGLAAVWTGSPTVKADVISEWNAITLDAIKSESLTAPEASRVLAMLNTAMYNAVEGIAGDHYVFTSAGYSGPSATAADGAMMEAAAAAAAHTFLQSLYDGNMGLQMQFASLYSSQISGMANNQARSDGISFGNVVGTDIVNWRTGDGSGSASDSGLYTPVGTVGHWMPTPPETGSLPGWGNVNTFGISGTAGFTSTLPTGTVESYIQSAQYTADYNQVKDLGSSSSGSRTVDQLEAAYFWSGRAGTTTTAGLWNTVAQTVAASEGLSLQDSARLFAALNVAMADASIVTWQTKYDTDFWSPLQAIVNGEFDGNASTLGDDVWAALLAELNAPAYFSDVSAISAAAAQVLAAFLGDNVAFSLDSDYDGDGIVDDTRFYNSFSEAADEAGLSQIWGGVSYGFSHTDGATAGAAVADEVMLNNFAPVPEPSGMLLVLLGGTLLLVRRKR